MTDWLRLARDAYQASNTYFDTNIRSQIERDLRQFQGVHGAQSKYHSDAYKARSKLFKPKTRSAIRKAEAQAASAFFANEDVLSVRAKDDNNPVQLASAEIYKALLQYRLTKSVPWFLVVIGAYQEAMNQGVICSHQYWEYNPKKKIDRPVIELQPVENIRIDPAANWMDPIASGPYCIRMIPMYVKDVQARMKTPDPKTGQPKWKGLTDAEIVSARRNTWDSIRSVREGKRTDSKEQSSALSQYEIVWVHENFIEHNGAEYVYYTLATEFELSAALPLETVYFHGKRPLVMGCALLEAHKIYPASVSGLTSDVQTEINEVTNSRIDNIKFILNKRYFVNRNKQVDLRSLTRNVPGSATLMNDVEKDVKVVDFNDVTASAYQEQDRLNLDFDDLVGTFSGSSVQANRKLNETVGGMSLLSSSANQVSEYQLRTFIETWAEPVLRQMVLLEAEYETDEKVLAIAGKRAKLVQRFGMDAVTDEMMHEEVTLTVNAGLAATNPVTQVERFSLGLKTLAEVVGPDVLAQRLQFDEVSKELFGKLGYKDGGRFFNPADQDDPRMAELTAQIEELQAKLAQKEDPELTAAKIRQIDAQALKTAAETVAKKVESIYSATNAAQLVATVPGVAGSADEILGSSGYEDMNAPPIVSEVNADVPPVDLAKNTSPLFPPNPDVGLNTGIEAA